MNDIPIYYKDGKVIDEQMSNIEKILHSSKINYEDLLNITNPYLLNNDKETINVFIDLYDFVFRPMYRPNLREEIATMKNSHKLTVVAEIINIIAHYRHFFLSRYNKYCTVILYYSDKKDTYLTKIDPNYKKSYYNKRLLSENNSEFYMVNKLIEDCLTIIKAYLTYIPHAYLINTLNLDPLSFFNKLKNDITTEELNNNIDVNNDFNIILSNNYLSLLNIIDNNNTIVLRNKVKDKPYYVDNTNIWKEFEVENTNGLPNNVLYLLCSMIGNSQYDIKNIDKIGKKKAFKILNKLFIEGNNLSNIINDYDKIKEIFKDYDTNVILKNLKLINHNTHPLTYSTKVNIIEQFNDILDLEYIKQETFKIFTATSNILFEYLFDGEPTE